MKLYHFVSAAHGLKDIRERRLKIAQIDKLNDPFEFLGAELSTIDKRKRLRKLKTELSEKRGLICFSKNWHNPVLWSHYADKHRGICLGFKISDDLPIQVSYVNSRFNWPSKIDDHFARQVICTKFAHWSYEDEYRIFTTLEDPEDSLYYKDFSNELNLVSVIVGSESQVTRHDLGQALGDLSPSVETFKARAAFKSFRIVKNENDQMWA